MKIFNKFVQVIAIKDAPIVNSNQFGNGIQAYKKGDIFEVISSFSGQILIWNSKFDSIMAVDSSNFELLSEHRNAKIDKILC
jgi:hypothetical protein